MSPPAPHKHLRVVSWRDSSAGGAREFRVRFTPEAGPGAWLRKPRNSFRWVGPGALRFDERGLEVSAKRVTLLGLRRTQRIIHAAEMRDASREGNAIQINLRGGTRTGWLRFWADDAAAAAEIVALLPTSRTVELDDTVQSTRARRAARVPAPWRLAAAAALVLALGWFAASRFLGPAEPAPERTPRPHRMSAAPSPAAANEWQRVVAEASEDELLLSWADLEKYGSAYEGLSTQFSTAFNALLAGSLSQEDFAGGLDRWLQPQWQILARGLPAAGSARLRNLADAELREVIVAWRHALALYAHGLRTADPAEVNRAFLYMRDAEAHRIRAQQLLEQIKRRRRDEAGGATDARTGAAPR